MPSVPLLRRRDPRWQEDGPVARREHRKRRVREVAAFATSLLAVAGAGVAWIVRLSLAGLGRG